MAGVNQKNTAATARAFATYALVPFLGILFCPGALFLGSLNLFNSYRLREDSDRGASFAILMIAVAELAAQLTMWWIMYKVPEWSAKSGQASLDNLWRP